MAGEYTFHGVMATEQQVAHEPVREARSGIPFVVGTAPVHTAGGSVNKPILCASFEDAREQLGYSDDWDNYTLCQVMDMHFKRYGAQPVVFVNVLDPATMKKDVAELEVDIKDMTGTLPLEAIAANVVVTTAAGETLTNGTDYELAYDLDGSGLILELMETGAGAKETMVKCAFTAVDPTAVTKKQIIGGKDAETRKVSGFEVLEYVYHMVGLAPDLLLCPKWSKDPEVALVMAAKAAEINCVFRGMALADIDCSVVRDYEDLEAYKVDNGLDAKKLTLCWPKDKYKGKLYDLSVALAGTMAVTDTAEGGIPCASPSNRTVLADAACLEDGTEIMLNVNEASRINHMGVVTILTKFIEGNTIYGDKTACWPEEYDPQNGDIAGARMFAYICNNLVVKVWNKVDKRLTRRLIQSVVDDTNRWLNALAADEKILGARVEFRKEDNPTEQLSQGKIVYRVYLGIAPTGRSIEFVVEQDLSYLDAAIESLAS